MRRLAKRRHVFAGGAGQAHPGARDVAEPSPERCNRALCSASASGRTHRVRTATRSQGRLSGRQSEYSATVSEDAGGQAQHAQLQSLRERADEDFLSAPVEKEAGRHQIDLAELGLRVSVTRSRYPNRPDGVDQYAVTVSRMALDRRPEEDEVRTVLSMTFGDAATEAIERGASAARVRMFRVPAGARQSV